MPSMLTWIKKEKAAVMLFLFLFLVYFSLQSYSIYGGDSGDIVSAAATGTFPHPPGYPLYTILARILLLIPAYTPAWRVSLMSSFFSAFSLVFFYKILIIYFKKTFSLFTILFLAFLYPVWLYSSIPEIFSFNTFFTVINLYILLQWGYTKKTKYAYLFALFFGLSLSHHHIIIFSVPAYFYVYKKLDIRLPKHYLKMILLFIFGLLPYLYLPIVSLSSKSLFFWGNAATVKGFYNIVTRRIYGSFQSFRGVANTPLQRFLSIWIFLRYLYLEYRPVGILFLGVGTGFYFLKKIRKNQKQFFILDVSAVIFISYLFFLFYASWPVTGDFLMATIERFYIVPLIFVSPFLTYGLELAFKFVGRMKNFNKIAMVFFSLVVLLIPIIALRKNLYKIVILKNDFTAEKLGYDILRGVDKNSILVLTSDTPNFDSEYVHYALDKRQDVLLLKPILEDQSYINKISQKYPDLILSNVSEEQPFSSFIEDNLSRRSFYLIQSLPIDGFTQVPEGLLLKYYSTDSTPSADLSYAKNKKLVDSFQDLTQSSIFKYENLFLTDVRNIYIIAYRKITQYFLNLGEYEKASFFAQKHSELVNKDDFLSYLFWGQIYFGQGKCGEAEKQFLSAKEKFSSSPLPDAFLRKTYLECFNDEKQAQQYLDSCIEIEKEILPKL
jgi:hypothetical protein